MGDCSPIGAEPELEQSGRVTMRLELKLGMEKAEMGLEAWPKEGAGLQCWVHSLCLWVQQSCGYSIKGRLELR